MMSFLTTLCLTFLFFLTAVFLMAIGVVISNKILQGSCGGTKKILGLKCLFCPKNQKCTKEDNTK